MKNSRFKYEYAVSASKQHRLVGDILRKSEFFKNYSIYQEYPVNKINEKFSSGREKFDWVVYELKLIIEVHGKQHYEPVRFGGCTPEQAIYNLADTKSRDSQKLDAAISMGWTYIEIRYDDKVDERYLINKFKEHFNSVSSTPEPKVKKKEKTKWQIAQLEKSREHRKTQYKKLKELRKEKNDV